MAYSQAVERWRPIVAKYFPPELVDKALYVISYESSGNPGAVGDGGAARGLFQIQSKVNFPNRPDSAWLDDPENNIKYAAQSLGAAKGKWTDWGEGTEKMAPYNPKTGKGRFGALGNHPYKGGSTVTQPTYKPFAASPVQSSGPGLLGDNAIISKAIAAAGPMPTALPGEDPAVLEERMAAWQTKVQSWVTMLKATTPADPAQPDPISEYQQGSLDLQGQQNGISALNSFVSILDAQVKLGELDQGTAAKKLDAWLTARTQADNEAQFLQKNAEMRIQYGIAPGTEKRTYADEGLGTYGQLLHGNANAPLHDYTGKTFTVDPEGDLARMRAQAGVSGPMPDLLPNDFFRSTYGQAFAGLADQAPGLLGGGDGYGGSGAYGGDGSTVADAPPLSEERYQTPGTGADALANLYKTFGGGGQGSVMNTNLNPAYPQTAVGAGEGAMGPSLPAPTSGILGGTSKYSKQIQDILDKKYGASWRTQSSPPGSRDPFAYAR